MGYLIFRDVSTESLSNVLVSKMPDPKKAAMRFSEYYVTGRDGALHVDEGYRNFELIVTLVLINGSASDRYMINAWADGTGKLVTSDDPTRAYQASVKDEIKWRRQKAQSAVGLFVPSKNYSLGDIVYYDGDIYKFTASHSGAWSTNDVTLIPVPNGFFDTAQITFTCQPYMFERVDSHIELTATGTIVNPGSATALPLIQVNGTGTCVFAVNGNEITLSNVQSGVPVYLDCDAGYVWAESGSAIMRGDFPVLNYGVNTVSITSGITSILITPHWRWI